VIDLINLPWDSIGPLLLLIVVWSAGPLAIVRLARICYPRNHPRRIGPELLDELVLRKPMDQLLWALQQLDRAFFEELLPRVVAVVRRLSQRWPRQRL
jgi:hypothetical protein